MSSNHRVENAIFLYTAVRTGSKKIQQGVSGSVAKWLIEFAEFLNFCCWVEQNIVIRVENAILSRFRHRSTVQPRGLEQSRERLRRA